MSLKSHCVGRANVRVPERVGDVKEFFVMEGQAFGFHPVRPSQISSGKAWRWKRQGGRT